ncbi:nucleotidyltransferase domain-containing protein [Kribbella deserti]|uniref:Nucleotidyltransferase domain-containing protein n=1 Tax=Kribbella deserti TaxID=1926257 RepID=A0ABV6QVD5_9ACTN
MAEVNAAGCHGVASIRLYSLALAAVGRLVAGVAGEFGRIVADSATRKVLRRLSTTGLVNPITVGASVQYVLNREHLAAEPVIELLKLRAKLIDRMREAIDLQWTEKPLTASLFGSAARGDGGVAGDIDLLVVRPADEIHPEWENQISSLANWVHRWTGNQRRWRGFRSTA